MKTMELMVKIVAEKSITRVVSVHCDVCMSSISDPGGPMVRWQSVLA